MARDMTEAEFKAALKRNGFKEAGFMGYVETTSGVRVCKFNAGSNRRQQLAYLIQEDRRWTAYKEEEAARKAMEVGWAGVPCTG